MAGSPNILLRIMAHEIYLMGETGRRREFRKLNTKMTEIEVEITEDKLGSTIEGWLL